MVAGGHPVPGRCGFGSHIITNTTTATRLCQPYHHLHHNQLIFQVPQSSPKIQWGLFSQSYVSCKITLAITTSSSDVVTDTVLLRVLRKKVPVPELIITIADKGLTIF